MIHLLFSIVKVHNQNAKILPFPFLTLRNICSKDLHNILSYNYTTTFTRDISVNCLTQHQYYQNPFSYFGPSVCCISNSLFHLEGEVYLLQPHI